MSKALLEKHSLENKARRSKMAIIDNVKEEVSRLPIHDRAMLAYWIITNLEEIDEPQEAVDAAWREEVRNRIKEIGFVFTNRTLFPCKTMSFNPHFFCFMH